MPTIGGMMDTSRDKSGVVPNEAGGLSVMHSAPSVVGVIPSLVVVRAVFAQPRADFAGGGD